MSMATRCDNPSRRFRISSMRTSARARAPDDVTIQLPWERTGRPASRAEPTPGALGSKPADPNGGALGSKPGDPNGCYPHYAMSVGVS
jgi:hypothetical protein